MSRAANVTAHLVHGLRNATLDAEMQAARDAGTLVNAWRLSDGREVLGTSATPEANHGTIAVALTDGRILRADWPEGVTARMVVMCIIGEPAETVGGLLS